LSPVLPFGGLIEVTQTFAWARCLSTNSTRGQQGDAVPRGNKIQVVAHFDSVSLNEAFGQSDLKFSGDFAHRSSLNRGANNVKEYILDFSRSG
jgi:hypothetical protein